MLPLYVALPHTSPLLKHDVADVGDVGQGSAGKKQGDEGRELLAR